MKPMLKLFSFFLFLNLLALPVQAKITVETDQKGTILFTDPEGKIQMLGENEPPPENIPSESTLEVFNGELKVSTEGQDKVALACLNHTASVEAGSAANLTCSETGGLLKAVKGSISLTDPTGKESILPEGKQFPITLNALVKAPATAAGEPTGGIPIGGDLADAAPVDSQSIEAATNQDSPADTRSLPSSPS
jgi:hypothetical protein